MKNIKKLVLGLGAAMVLTVCYGSSDEDTNQVFEVNAGEDQSTVLGMTATETSIPSENTATVAVDDFRKTSYNTSILIDVLANDNPVQLTGVIYMLLN